MSESVEKQIEKVLTTDGRTKLFKEKLKKLGYIKASAKKINKVMTLFIFFADALI